MARKDNTPEADKLPSLPSLKGYGLLYENGHVGNQFPSPMKMRIARGGDNHTIAAHAPFPGDSQLVTRSSVSMSPSAATYDTKHGLMIGFVIFLPMMSA